MRIASSTFLSVSLVYCAVLGMMVGCDSASQDGTLDTKANRAVARSTNPASEREDNKGLKSDSSGIGSSRQDMAEPLKLSIFFKEFVDHYTTDTTLALTDHLQSLLEKHGWKILCEGFDSKKISDDEDQYALYRYINDSDLALVGVKSNSLRIWHTTEGFHSDAWSSYGITIGVPGKLRDALGKIKRDSTLILTIDKGLTKKADLPKFDNDQRTFVIGVASEVDVVKESGTS